MNALLGPMFREYTDDYRFTLPWLAAEVGVRRAGRYQRAELARIVTEAGAEHIGKAWVNGEGGRGRQVDYGWRVEECVADDVEAAVRAWAERGAPGIEVQRAVREKAEPKKRGIQAGKIDSIISSLDRLDAKLDRLLQIIDK